MMTLRIVTTSPAPVQADLDNPTSQFIAAIGRLDADLADDLDMLGRYYVAAMLADGDDGAARLADLRATRTARMEKYAADQNDVINQFMNFGV